MHFSNCSDSATSETPEMQRKNNVFNVFLLGICYNRTFTYCHIVIKLCLYLSGRRFSFMSKITIHGTIKVVKIN